MNPFWNRRNAWLAVATVLASLAPMLRAQEVAEPAPEPTPSSESQGGPLAGQLGQLQDAAGRVREASRQVVVDCVKSTSPGATRSVDYVMQSPCSPTRTYSGPVHYDITRDEDSLRLTIPLEFRLKPGAAGKLSEERRRQMLDGARGCESTIQSYWARYGIRVEVPMREATVRKSPNAAQPPPRTPPPRA